MGGALRGVMRRDHESGQLARLYFSLPCKTKKQKSEMYEMAIGIGLAKYCLMSTEAKYNQSALLFIIASLNTPIRRVFAFHHISISPTKSDQVFPVSKEASDF